MKLVDDLFGHGPFGYLRGKYGRSRGGSEMAHPVEESFQMLHRYDAGLDDKRVGTGNAMALEDLVPVLHLLLKRAHKGFRSSD